MGRVEKEDEFHTEDAVSVFFPHFKHRRVLSDQHIIMQKEHISYYIRMHEWNLH